MSALTYAQNKLMEKAPAEWADLPSGVGCTNATLSALEKRKLVELRIKPGEYHRFYSGWQWRKMAPVDTEKAS